MSKVIYINQDDDLMIGGSSTKESPITSPEVQPSVPEVQPSVPEVQPSVPEPTIPETPVPEPTVPEVPVAVEPVAVEQSEVKSGGDSSKSVMVAPQMDQSSIASDSDDENSDDESIGGGKRKKYKEYSDSDNDDSSSISSVLTDDILKLDPLYIRLTHFLKHDNQNITEVLFGIQKELQLLNVHIKDYLQR
jgi:hypothetical protein